MAKVKRSAGVGWNALDLGPQSLMRLERFNVVKPRAASVTLVVGSTAVTGVAAGAALTLAYTGKLRQARRITMTITDAAFASALTCTVIVKGHRFGVEFIEELTATSTNTSPLTVTTNKYFDQVTSVTLKSKSNDAASDTISIGISGVGFGLPYPIDRVEDVLMIARNNAGTEGQIAVSSSSVDRNESAIIGLTLVAADDYEVEFLRSRKTDGFGRAGVF